LNNNQELKINSVDKLEQMLGSYGPSPTNEPYIKNFDPEESPSGMLARSGTYSVRSRVIDDDGEVYAGLFFSSLLLFHVLTCIDIFRLGMEFQTCKRMVKSCRSIFCLFDFFNVLYVL
jgi:hypothetical protein